MGKIPLYFLNSISYNQFLFSIIRQLCNRTSYSATFQPNLKSFFPSVNSYLRSVTILLFLLCLPPCMQESHSRLLSTLPTRSSTLFYKVNFPPFLFFSSSLRQFDDKGLRQKLGKISSSQLDLQSVRQERSIKTLNFPPIIEAFRFLLEVVDPALDMQEDFLVFSGVFFQEALNECPEQR